MGHQGSDWMILGGYRKTSCRKITSRPEGTSCDEVPEVDAAHMGIDSGEDAITLELQNHPSEKHCLFVINVSAEGLFAAHYFDLFTSNNPRVNLQK